MLAIIKPIKILQLKQHFTKQTKKQKQLCPKKIYSTTREKSLTFMTIYLMIKLPQSKRKLLEMLDISEEEITSQLSQGYQLLIIQMMMLFHLSMNLRSS